MAHPSASPFPELDDLRLEGPAGGDAIGGGAAEVRH